MEVINCASYPDGARDSRLIHHDLESTAVRDCTDEALIFHLAATADRPTFNLLFEEVFNRYNGRIEKWCYKVVRDRDAALDLTQEVLVKAFRCIHTFRGDSRLSTWLYAIARNQCLNSLKKAKHKNSERALTGSPKEIPSREEDALSALSRTQSYQEMLRVLGSILTPVEVEVFALHYVQELTLPAITRRLMLTNASGAKAYMVSARRKLKFWGRGYKVRKHNLIAFIDVATERKKAA